MSLKQKFEFRKSLRYVFGSFGFHARSALKRQKDAKFLNDHFEPLTKVLSIKEQKFWAYYVLGEMAQEFRLKMPKNPIFWKIKIK